MDAITLDQIEAIDSETLKPADVAAYLRTNPSTISEAANRGLLPWAYKLCSRTVIPKQAFISYHRYGQAIIHLDKPQGTQVAP